MAAFTTFTEEALSRYLVMFGKGDLAGHEVIEGGIENSNYRVTLDRDGEQNHYVLTIVEGFDFNEVPFFNKVMTHLFHYGLPVAAPIATLDGMTSTIFCGKPTFLFPQLDGDHPGDVTERQCTEIGRFMAQSHQALLELKTERDNPFNAVWMQESISANASRLGPEDNEFLIALVSDYEQIQNSELPSGIIHGDLFRDNALFTDSGDLSGVIDFYHACNDLLIQDVAIAINDWCLKGNRIDRSLQDALMTGYEEIRSLTDQERDLLPRMQRVSAARFALTRLLSGDPPLKDPHQMLELAKTF